MQISEAGRLEKYALQVLGEMAAYMQEHPGEVAGRGIFIILSSYAGMKLYDKLFPVGIVDDVGNAASKWKFGEFKSVTKWQNRMTKRGWTPEQITEALKSKEVYQMVNEVNLGNQALRYVHPTTGTSVVINSVTNEMLQIGGEGVVW